MPARKTIVLIVSFLFCAGAAQAQQTKFSATASRPVELTVPEISASRADSSKLHGLVFAIEGGTDMVLTERYRSQFDSGYHAITRVGLAFTRQFLVQASFGNWWFPSRSGPVGRMFAMQLGVRAKFPLFDGIGGGPIIDANGGLGLTGGLKRVVFDAGVGWEFPVADWFGVGPIVRYTQIVQPQTETVSNDARYFLIGLGMNARWPWDRPNPTPPLPPEPVDTDGDGIVDSEDRCPRQPEDRDQFEDIDGCPDPDNDQDGMPDVDDQCPLRAENRNGFQDDDGCPDEAPRPAPAAALPAQPPEPKLLPQHVLFKTNKSKIRSAFRKEIKVVCAHMKQNPDQRIRVLGHADDTGSAAKNTRLAARRASIVTEYMLKRCELSPDRLELRAFGDTRGVCAEDSKDCLQKNRRVVFEVLEPPE